MKNSIFTLFFIVMTGTMLLNCQSSTNKEDIANKKIQNAELCLTDDIGDTIKVLTDTTTAYQKFILESENRVRAYEKEIANLKIRIADEKKSEKAVYVKKLEQMEQKKELIKSKVIQYKDKQLDDWDKKQVGFQKDLDDLGIAIADFFESEE